MEKITNTNFIYIKHLNLCGVDISVSNAHLIYKIKNLKSLSFDYNMISISIKQFV